jgi:superfamily I DNA/RNA helicase
MTEAELFTRLAKHYAEGAAAPFDFAVVDEAQDVCVAELRCLAAMAGSRPNGLFFAGDTGQRIFQQPFSGKSVGVDVRHFCALNGTRGCTGPSPASLAKCSP